MMAANGNREQLQEHHKKTGCNGELREYEDKPREVKGMFCSCCKDEWLLEDLNINPVPSNYYDPVFHHNVPTFCCVQVSDTGSFIKWDNINKSGGLLPGDHVAWLRFISYWHHAIVETVNDDSIEVIEWSTSIHRKVRHKWDLIGNCCYSPMYKVSYPQAVEDQNPRDLVLLRARARVGDIGYGPFSDNCEHFATFCKTGLHRCNQLHQFQITLRAWLRRFVVSFIHITLIVSFSETIERYAGQQKDWLGAVLLIISEIVYLNIYLCVVYRVDTRRERFKMGDSPSITRACRCASIKTILQSFMVICFSITFSVYLARYLNGKDSEPWSEAKHTWVQIALGVAGGLIGNIVGFFLFSYVPYPCCRNENLPLRLITQEEANEPSPPQPVNDDFEFNER